MKIVLSTILAFFIVGCGGDMAKSEVQKTEPAKVVVKEKTSVVVKSTPTVTQVKEDAIEVAANSVEIVKEEFSRVVDVTKDATKSAVSTATKKVQEVVEDIIPSTIDAQALYKSCTGCHGANGEKKALGKSQVIKGWSVEKTTTALNGYKAGTYGGTMKGMMKGQVSKLSTSEIKAISEYVSKL